MNLNKSLIASLVSTNVFGFNRHDQEISNCVFESNISSPSIWSNHTNSLSPQFLTSFPHCIKHLINCKQTHSCFFSDSLTILSNFFWDSQRIVSSYSSLSSINFFLLLLLPLSLHKDCLSTILSALLLPSPKHLLPILQTHRIVLSLPNL